MRDDEVRQQALIDASASDVFDAWSDPVELERWYVDRAEGNARWDGRVTWNLGGSVEPLIVKRSEPNRRLIWMNEGSTWHGSVLDVQIEERLIRRSPFHTALTRIRVTQKRFPPALRSLLPIIGAGWACMLAILKEYLEQHRGRSRRQIEISRPLDGPGAPDAFASASAMEAWMGEAPLRLLATTPMGAVVSLPGFEGLFTLMRAGGVRVRYTTWNEADLGAPTAKAEALADRLNARLAG